MNAHLRIARPASNLARSVEMYLQGLSLTELARFSNHDGFDGVMLGDPEGPFHFEITYCRHHPVTPAPTAEDLLVFYIADPQAWEERCARLSAAGFTEVSSFNPYWARQGRTFQDPDGYRIVIQRSGWSNTP
ncbi:MAG: VOC family protein [Verrucomicrobiales bacterium]|nr:VOC family protein [Verrucomicrobiales bacterium]